ncbi:ArsR/SmtB family transcription factor [Cochlodiniinecator piscidefendens]|uniref:ArsR/SmtB family transcription factor n=1 Tax=Cochlodiniinecator piscidefendens TaxID=2715756 RepID=UPI00140D48C8|nr:metalloregulator ArsR/SmtB family transcription factor [Cochlodiniinecator piscidefendens]
METINATEIFATLGHEGRLSVLRLLIAEVPDPLRPTDIAATLGLKANTLSTYLSVLERVGLIQSKRDGTSIYYTASMPQMGALIEFLSIDCCNGHPETCGLPQFQTDEEEGFSDDKDRNQRHRPDRETRATLVLRRRARGGDRPAE